MILLWIQENFTDSSDPDPQHRLEMYIQSHYSLTVNAAIRNTVKKQIRGSWACHKCLTLRQATTRQRN